MGEAKGIAILIWNAALLIWLAALAKTFAFIRLVLFTFALNVHQ
jgi:hypothetical protein